jgi:hypothetical protein
MYLIKVGQKLDILQMYHKQKNKALQQDQNNKFYQQYQILEILLKLLEVGLIEIEYESMILSIKLVWICIFI